MARFFREKIIVVMIMALCLVGLSGMQMLQAADTKGSVTFTYDGIADCTIQMYYVADYSETDGYTLESAFAETAMSRQDLLDGKWYSLALTLENLVVSHQIAADASGKTDSNGQLTLSNLEEGLYLVTIERMTVDDTVYTAQPLLIMVPDYATDGSKDYDRSITITKYETQETQKTTSVSIQKIWDDEDASNRPDSIEVYLYKGTDGTIADTQVLSEDNNWRYTWSELDASAVWYVAEEDMTEYGVSYSLADDGTIVITNQQGTGKTEVPGYNPYDGTEDGTTEITETESESETETDTGSEAVSEDTENASEAGGNSSGSSEDMIYQELENSESSEAGDGTGAAEDTNDSEGTSSGGAPSGGISSNGTGSGSESGSDDTLPQTGASWEMVLMLMGAAALCFVVGISKMRRRKLPD